MTTISDKASQNFNASKTFSMGFESKRIVLGGMEIRQEAHRLSLRGAKSALGWSWFLGFSLALMAVELYRHRPTGPEWFFPLGVGLYVFCMLCYFLQSRLQPLVFDGTTRKIVRGRRCLGDFSTIRSLRVKSNWSGGCALRATFTTGREKTLILFSTKKAALQQALEHIQTFLQNA